MDELLKTKPTDEQLSHALELLMCMDKGVGEGRDFKILMLDGREMTTEEVELITWVMFYMDPTGTAKLLQAEWSKAKKSFN